MGSPFLQLPEFDWQKPHLDLLASKEWLLAEIDYSGIELVILATLAQEEVMLEAVRRGEDFHLATARKMFGVPDMKKSDPRRAVGKTLNFGKVYGQSVRAFAEKVGCSLDQAKEFFDQFDTGFPRIEQYYQSIDRLVHSGEMVETLFGRLRSFFITGKYRHDSGQLRQARNYVVQSPASDMTLHYLNLIFEWLDAKPIRHNYLIPVNTVHDSIWFLVAKSKWAPMLTKARNIMEDNDSLPTEVIRRLGRPWPVPRRTEVKAGYDLANMKKVLVKAA